MIEKSQSFIRGKINISNPRLIIAWLFLVVFPVIASLAALDYFFKEYAQFAESGKLAEAFNQLEQFKDNLVVENFLKSKLPELKKLQADGNNQEQLDQLKNRIDAIIGGKSLMCAFFGKDKQRIQMRTCRPADLSDITFPPAALFKRQLQLVSQSADHAGQLLRMESEKRRVAMSMQQIFKSLTPITLRTDKVAKNFSKQFGGDLYFIYTEFASGSKDVAGCLVVLRGQDFSTRFMLDQLQQQFPRCRVIMREMKIEEYENHPENLNSGVLFLKDRLQVTSSAEQRFIRHVLHGGGISLLPQYNRKVPFIQFSLPLSDLQHQLAGFRHLLRILAIIILTISGVYCLRAGLFGINPGHSFKKRMLITTCLAALFPFTFFSASFYLHIQYDEFLNETNLLQHINTRLTLLNSELDQYFSDIEGSLSVYLQQITRKNYNNDTEMLKIFDSIGAAIPISKVSLQRLDRSVTKEFAERSSFSFSNISNDTIEEFFPLRSLQLLNERAPLDRTRQDILTLPGETVKIALIAKTLVSNGTFYCMDQDKLPIWWANFKVIDNESPNKPVLALLLSRFESGPLLKDFLQKNQCARMGYQETFDNFQVSYAFFPTERTGSHLIWQGSGFTTNQSMQKAAERERSETITGQAENGTPVFTVSRMNHGLPHVAVAFAQLKTAASSLQTSLIVGISSFFYLFLVLFLVGKLLDAFFVSPVMALAKSAEEIARGGAAWNLQLETGDEFTGLNNSFSAMVKGLQQRNMLRDYVSADAFSDLATSGSRNLAPGGEYREATILFVAIKDYQVLTAEFNARQTVELLNRFTTLGDRIVKEHGGSIDKILNHTLMLVFRENSKDEESHALRAARTAIRIAENANKEGLPGIYAGISSGTVISGKIGSYQGKLDFTVIGSPVNLAARLKAEAIDSNTGIIISGATMRLLKGRGRVQFLRRCSLKGKAREYNIYELCDLRQN